MLEQLQKRNSRPILSLSDPLFQSFGRVLTDFHTEEITQFMKQNTPIPEQGNIYIPSVPEMEALPLFSQIKHSTYGGMDIQIGYCNGRNTTYNGCEYHKGSELTLAITDLMILFGHTWDIQDNTYDNSLAHAFYVPQGTFFEIYQTTLHLSPCRTSLDGFQSVIILPRGTNTPLSETQQKTTAEDTLLLLKNKWIIAHKDREPLVKAGAHIGIIGDNFELFHP